MARQKERWQLTPDLLRRKRKRKKKTLIAATIRVFVFWWRLYILSFRLPTVYHMQKQIAICIFPARNRFPTLCLGIILGRHRLTSETLRRSKIHSENENPGRGNYRGFRFGVYLLFLMTLSPLTHSDNRDEETYTFFPKRNTYDNSNYITTAPWLQHVPSGVLPGSQAPRDPCFLHVPPSRKQKGTWKIKPP